MFIAHGPLSALLMEKIRRRYFNKIDGKFIPGFIILTILAGILPDFDFFILAAQAKPAFLHHSLITHTPIFWIAVSGVVYIVLKFVQRYAKEAIGTFLKNGGTNLITLSLLIGSLSHVFSDMFTGHIMILYPLTSKAFTLTANILPINPITSYFFHPFFIVELGMVLIFLAVITPLLFNIPLKIQRIVTGASILIITILLVGTTYLHQNTYNPGLPKDSRGMYVYDRDEDYVHDYRDYDINNNGIDNIEDANRNVIAKNAKTIIMSNTLATFNNPRLERIGYISPFGLISATYYKSGYTLEPVIKRILSSQDQDLDIRYNLNTYYDTLTVKDGLRKIDRGALNIGKADLGKTIFIIVDGKVETAGIIIEGGYIATVFKNDRRLKLHTIDEFIEQFKDGATLEIER